MIGLLRYGFVRPLAVLLLTVPLVASCGKKGEPTLKAYEKPPAPAALTALHRDHLLLRWNYPPAKEPMIVEFLILRSTGGDFEKLAHIAREKRSYIDRDVKTGSVYRYRVLAQNYKGVYSDPSDTVEAAPVDAPPPPSGLAYTVTGSTVEISWTPQGSGAKFNIYRAGDDGKYGLTPLNAEPVDGRTFRDAFSVNRVARYRVRSLTGSLIRDESEASEELVMDPADLVPSRPVGLEAYPSPDRVLLAWTESAESWVTEYRIYRRTGGGDFVLLGSTQIPTFADLQPASGAADYRVAAVGRIKEGQPAELHGVIYVPQR